MIKSRFYLLGCLILIFSACRKENSSMLNTQKQVYFSSSIAGLPQTKVDGKQWNTDDAIGIFMVQHGLPLNATSIVENGFNKPYTTNGNGNFSPKSAADALKFPTGKQVDFVAYYPFKNSNTLTPVLDIQDQQNQSQLDFMVALNKEGLSKGLVSLSFERQMAKLELKVKGTDLSGLKADFIAMPSVAEFDLGKGDWMVHSSVKDLPAKVSTNTMNETIVEWTVFPSALTAQNKIVFTKADGKTFTWNMTSGTSFVKGHRYQYEILLGKDGGVDPNPTVSYMELPLITTGQHLKYSLKMSSATRRNYSMLYDTDNKVAYWVAYPLSSDYLGSQDRTNRWDYDPDYNVSWQANLTSGYPNNAVLQLDRGHQLPSGDRTATYQENASTFYFTNMTPQNRSLNQGLWQNLETKVRTWAGQESVDTLYVVTGAALTTATDKKIDYVKDNSDANVAKPKYYYKALAMKRGSTYYTVGFRINNTEPPSKADYMNYMVTVESLEKETGFTFFPALSKEVKSNIDTQIWRK